MSIGWGDLVDVPAEEPEQLMSPEQVYISDPVVYDAVNRLMRGNSKIKWADAVREVAKTVAPSPHNIAAQDARYLLCPEAASHDEAMWSGNPHTSLEWAEDVEEFERIAEAQAAHDGPDEDSADVHLSAGMTNRAGVQVGPEEQRRPISNPFEAPVPPQGEEPGARIFDYTYHFLAADLDDLIDVDRAEINMGWDRLITAFGNKIIEEDSIPLSAPTMSFGVEREHVVVRMRVTAVPALERTWNLHAFIGTVDATQMELEHFRAELPSCCEMESSSYPVCKLVVSWDRHEHRTGGILIAGGGGDLREVLAELFGVPIEAVMPVDQVLGQELVTDGEQDPDS